MDGKPEQVVICSSLGNTCKVRVNRTVAEIVERISYERVDEARRRFNKYIRDLNTELLTNYGKIDILWYDVSLPMETWEGWDSLELNQHMRELQPHILINDRSKLPEDFGTPEEHIKAADRDWEACMTFNGISWGYVDS